MRIKIRRIKDADLDSVASIHSSAFPSEKYSDLWISCNASAFPRMQYFVALVNNKIVGYINWMQKCGFRDNQLLELEQIAVHSDFQNQGIGKSLIQKSLSKIETHLSKRGAKIENILVTTATTNHARRLYEKTIGAQPEHIIRNYVSGKDELYMLSRDFKGKDYSDPFDTKTA